MRKSLICSVLAVLFSCAICACDGNEDDVEDDVSEVAGGGNNESITSVNLVAYPISTLRLSRWLY